MNIHETGSINFSRLYKILVKRQFSSYLKTHKFQLKIEKISSPSIKVTETAESYLKTNFLLLPGKESVVDPEICIVPTLSSYFVITSWFYLAIHKKRRFTGGIDLLIFSCRSVAFWFYILVSDHK